jgi:hypothetical protein
MKKVLTIKSSKELLAEGREDILTWPIIRAYPGISRR